MPSSHGGLLNTGGLGAAYRIMKHASASLEGSSPEEVLTNFIEMLKRAHPVLRTILTLYTPWLMIAVALSRIDLLTRMLSSGWHWMKDKLISRVTIPATHPLQKQVMFWMLQHGLKDARTLALTPPHIEEKGASRFDLDYLSPGRHAKPKVQEEKKSDELIFVPDVGEYNFSYKGYSMTFEKRTVKQDEQNERTYRLEKKDIDTIVISCYAPFAGAKPIQQFLEHVKINAAASEDHMTKIFRAHQLTGAWTWDEGRSRPSRKLAAVTLDAHIKAPLVKDIEDYLNPKTKSFYVQNGIPYRKGYLLYGPPGTGKTSFATALAGEYGLNVYLLSLSDSSLSDKVLESLFEQLPTKCIVLMEDIDSAGIKRENMKGDTKPKKKKRSRRSQQQYMMRVAQGMAAGTAWPDQADEDEYDDEDNDGQHPPAPAPHTSFRTGVTLSGLLNVLDGVNAAEGRIVLMTSNDPDSLDKALVRAGRIDRKILFGYASNEVAGKLFQKIFTKTREQLLEGEKSFANVPALAEQFANAIPAGTITPAEIQQHLLTWRADPVLAVEKAPEFAERIVEEKKSGKNVAAFENEVTAKSATADVGLDIRPDVLENLLRAQARMQAFGPGTHRPRDSAVVLDTSPSATPSGDEDIAPDMRSSGVMLPNKKVRLDSEQRRAQDTMVKAINDQLAAVAPEFAQPTTRPASSTDSRHVDDEISTDFRDDFGLDAQMLEKPEKEVKMSSA